MDPSTSTSPNDAELAMTEQERFALHNKLTETIGSEVANTLMEHLPPLAWDQIATKEDLNIRFGALDGQIGAIQTEIKGVQHQIDAQGTALRCEMSELRGDLHTDISKLRSEVSSDIGTLRSDMNEFRTDMTTQFGQFRSELQGELGQFRAEINSDIGTLRSDMSEFRTDMTTQFGQFQSDLQGELGQFQSQLTTDQSKFQSQLTTNQIKFQTEILGAQADSHSEFNGRLGQFEERIGDKIVAAQRTNFVLIVGMMASIWLSIAAF